MTSAYPALSRFSRGLATTADLAELRALKWIRRDGESGNALTPKGREELAKVERGLGEKERRQ